MSTTTTETKKALRTAQNIARRAARCEHRTELGFQGERLHMLIGWLNAQPRSGKADHQLTDAYKKSRAIYQETDILRGRAAARACARLLQVSVKNAATT
jgi:hypothetical protein